MSNPTNAADELLKECPFCGNEGDPFIQTIGNEHTKERGADVGCRTCGFSKHIRVIRYSCEWAVARAKEAWNTRVNPSAYEKETSK